MKRIVLGLVLGLVLASAAHGEEGTEKTEKLTDTPLLTNSNGAFVIPQEYGHLVSVVESADVHYLYFQDAAGQIRILLLGPRTSASRARTPVQLLNSNVVLIKRGPAEPAS